MCQGVAELRCDRHCFTETRCWAAARIDHYSGGDPVPHILWGRLWLGRLQQDMYRKRSCSDIDRNASLLNVTLWESHRLLWNFVSLYCLPQEKRKQSLIRLLMQIAQNRLLLGTCLCFKFECGCLSQPAYWVTWIIPCKCLLRELDILIAGKQLAKKLQMKICPKDHTRINPSVPGLLHEQPSRVSLPIWKKSQECSCHRAQDGFEDSEVNVILCGSIQMWSK